MSVSIGSLNVNVLELLLISRSAVPLALTPCGPAIVAVPSITPAKLPLSKKNVPNSLSPLVGVTMCTKVFVPSLKLIVISDSSASTTSGLAALCSIAKSAANVNPSTVMLTLLPVICRFVSWLLLVVSIEKPNVPPKVASSAVKLVETPADPVPTIPSVDRSSVALRLSTVTSPLPMSTLAPLTPTVRSEPLDSKLKLPSSSDWPVWIVNEPVAPIEMLLSPLPVFQFNVTASAAIDTLPTLARLKLSVLEIVPVMPADVRFSAAVPPLICASPLLSDTSRFVAAMATVFAPFVVRENVPERL